MSEFFTSGASDSTTFNLVVNLVVFITGLTMAFASGRAVAQTWRPIINVPIYAAILTCAERFLHYALTGQPLLAPGFYVMSFIPLLVLGLLGYRRMRVKQMTTQYSWLLQAAGPLGWKDKS